MHDNAARMNRAATLRGEKLGSMDARESMQSYAELAEMHASNMEKLASSFAALYASFPDQQKQVADSVFRKRTVHPVSHNG